MWALDSKDDWEYLNLVEDIFKAKGATVYYVELEADYDVRIKRNKTENRLLNKPSKRDINNSELLFRRLEDKYRLNSFDNEIRKENYIKINNTDISPDIVA
jgi:ectoine hydroxylase-related dioxygenase (phytanoyl-CoA dioxygenase family)